METITLEAFGKINIFLDITGKRPDGYHLVRMVMQTVSLSDEVSVSAVRGGGGFDVEVSCDNPAVPADERNIAYKAAALIAREKNLKGKVLIKIKKKIPAAAGMAGGSADAAAVIKALDSLFELEMSEQEKDSIAVRLGADVPFALRKGVYLCEGIGEVLTKLPPLPSSNVLAVNPGFEISTKAAYENYDSLPKVFHPDCEKLLDAIGRENFEGICAGMANVLEAALPRGADEIKRIKDKMKALGADGTLMTGSGPTVFGLFKDESSAKAAFDALKKEYRNTYLTCFERDQ